MSKGTGKTREERRARERKERRGNQDRPHFPSGVGYHRSLLRLGWGLGFWGGKKNLIKGL